MTTYHERSNKIMDDYVYLVYRVTKSFPKDEMFGVVSQLRRASLSVVLNYIEGFARRSGKDCKTYKNFMRISYGSLKESRYLIHFSLREDYLPKDDFHKLDNLNNEIGAMLYKIIN